MLLCAALAAAAPARAMPSVCSPLDFGGVTWPSSLTPDDREALKAGLSISGSYEGPDSWSNITDNFDGQGLSLGLLNQCLGQGSLQPMLIRLNERHPEAFELLGPERRKSLLGMLARWRKAAAQETPSAVVSPLDEPAAPGEEMSGSNKASVDWAVKTLYKNGAFVPEWKSELMALAAAPAFVSEQIEAALALHDQALADEKVLSVRELRAYLMLFDVMVQNGGLKPEDVADYRAYLQTHPAAPATDRLEKILELRLRHVRSKYVPDVRARKRAIIHGKGNVHGEPRDLPGQYCYDGLWPYR